MDTLSGVSSYAYRHTNAKGETAEACVKRQTYMHNSDKLPHCASQQNCAAARKCIKAVLEDMVASLCNLARTPAECEVRCAAMHAAKRLATTALDEFTCTHMGGSTK
eukprot:6490816-Amphidinium_carterae.1